VINNQLESKEYNKDRNDSSRNVTAAPYELLPRHALADLKEK
jgi:hypothetical protein